MKHAIALGLIIIFTGIALAQKFPNDAVTKQLIKTMSAKVVKASAQTCDGGPLVQVASYDGSLDKADRFLRGIGYARIEFIGQNAKGQNIWALYGEEDNVITVALLYAPSPNKSTWQSCITISENGFRILDTRTGNGQVQLLVTRGYGSILGTYSFEGPSRRCGLR